MNLIQLKNSFIGIVTKEIIRWLRIWPQTLIPPMITSTLYFLVFGQVIGAKVGSISALPYSTFIAPGLIMMAVIINSYTNVASSLFSAKFARYIEEMLVSPTPYWIIVSGYVIGGALRGLTIGILVFIVTLFFSGIHLEHAWMMLLTLVLTSVLFALAGCINGIFAKKFDDTMLFSSFILTPLIYLGGLFYSINDLPHWAQLISKFNPIYYIITLFRGSMLDLPMLDLPGPRFFFSMTLLFGLITLLFTVSIILLKKGVGSEN